MPLWKPKKATRELTVVEIARMLVNRQVTHAQCGPTGVSEEEILYFYSFATEYWLVRKHSLGIQERREAILKELRILKRETFEKEDLGINLDMVTFQERTDAYNRIANEKKNFNKMSHALGKAFAEFCDDPDLFLVGPAILKEALDYLETVIKFELSKEIG